VKKCTKVARFQGIFFLKLPSLDCRSQQVTKIQQDFKFLLYASLTCNHIWPIPLVDDRQYDYITKLKKSKKN
jgi:hypothetical protein